MRDENLRIVALIHADVLTMDTGRRAHRWPIGSLRAKRGRRVEPQNPARSRPRSMTSRMRPRGSAPSATRIPSSRALQIGIRFGF
jgi:hypothetical protein